MKPLYNSEYIDLPAWTQVLETDERECSRHMMKLEDMLRAYHGEAYEFTEGKVSPENFYYSYVTATVPGLVVDNPRVLVRSRREGMDDPVSLPMKHGLNRWIRDENLARTLKQIAHDFCFGWGVGIVSHEADRYLGTVAEQALFDEKGRLRAGENRTRPGFYRLSPRLFSMDSRALDPSRAGHMSHAWFASARDIQADAQDPDNGWKSDVVAALVKDASSNRDAATQADPSRRSRSASHKTDELEFRTVWVPSMITDGKGPDEGYHGSVLTFCRTNSGEQGKKYMMPKDPEPFFGPKTGPYTLFGAYTVPDKLWPMGPLVANQATIEELNRHARSISRANSRGKNVLLYDMKDKAAATKIKNSPSDYLIGIPNMDSSGFVQATFGFASPQQYTAFQMLQGQLQRNASWDSAQQGQVSGTGTATENQIVNEVNQRRSGALYRTFSDATNAVLMKVAHYLYWDENIKFPIPMDEAFMEDFPEAAGQQGYATFEGGKQRKNKNITFEDYEIEIEAYSMGRTEQAQLSSSLQQFMAYLLPTLQLRPAMPFVDWQALDELYAQQLNTPELARIVDNVAALQSQPFESGGVEPTAKFQNDMLPPGAGRPQVTMNRPAPKQPEMPQQNQLLTQ